jgi:gliding motility-associated lipoprotein GldK
MVYIPTGVLHIGPSDQDVNNAQVARAKQVSIVSFYMDDTEITNNEYRQFVNWVRDSVTHVAMEHTTEDANSGKSQIDWKQKLDYKNKENNEQMEGMFLPEAQRYWDLREIDVAKFYYTYQWMDFKQAALSVNKNASKSDFVRTETVKVYPDTLVWVRDFTYSYNEPMTRNYFHHPAYDDYPVVGVTFAQSVAFNFWRTRLWWDNRAIRGEVQNDVFRLPTEHEWEYAARGGKKLAPYPWGGPYVRNSKGCVLANFKPGRGNYPEDGGFYTVRADSYWPNDYGLYNMAGNVSEWTSTAYYENSYSFVHDLNPDMRYDEKQDEAESLKRKTIRGGSWKDIGYYIENGTRHWEYTDSCKSYIGFRCVTTFLGRDIADATGKR